MNAIKTARQFIENQPEHADAAALSALVLALESEMEFPLRRLYDLQLENFELALEILGEWRLDRYYKGKAKLFSVSMQLQEQQGEGAPQA